MCAAEVETAKKAEADKKEEAKAERKKPLGEESEANYSLSVLTL